MLAPKTLIGRYATWDDYRGVITDIEWREAMGDWACTIWARRDNYIQPSATYVVPLGKLSVRA